MVISLNRANFVLVVSVILMTVALFARDLYGMGVGRIIFIVLAVVPAIIMNYQSLVYFIFFLFSLTSGLPGNYIFPILILILLCKNKNSFNRAGLKCFLLLVFMELIHYVTYGFQISLPSIIGYFSNLFFLFYFVTLKDESVDVKKCIVFFCMGLAVFLFAIFYITQINEDVGMLLEKSGRIGDTKDVSDLAQGEMMLNANPNELGFFAVIGVASIMVLYFRKQVSFWIMALLSALYLFVGALAVSRTYLLVIVIMVVLLVFFAPKNNGGGGWKRYLLLFVFIATAGYFLFNNASLVNAYNNRFESVSTDTYGGRTTIFADYNSFLVDHPLYFLFGTGAVYYGRVIQLGISIHNGTQQILVSYGLIGLAFFVFITIRAIKLCYKKGVPVCLIPFIIAFFYVQSGQLLNPSNNLYLFIVSFFIMKLSVEEHTGVRVIIEE